MKELYIDFDGVILDTISVTYKILEKEKIDLKDFEKTNLFYQNIDWKKLIEKSSQINNSIDCIGKIIESNLYKVNILSHVNSLEEAIEKVKFIRKYFKDITIIPVPKKISKTKMVHTKGAILIDDYAHNLKEWEESGGIGIRFSEKLNGKGYKVINRLDMLLEIPNILME